MNKGTQSDDNSDLITLDNIDTKLGAIDPNARQVVTRKSDSPDSPQEEDEESEDDDDVEEKEEQATPPEEEVVTPTEDPAPTTEIETPPPIKIDDTEYTREELEQIFAYGKSIADRKKKDAGYDPFLLERDYRVKSHHLSQYEQKFGRLDGSAPAAPQEQAPTSQPSVDISDIDPGDVARIEKILQAKGVVFKDDLAKQEVQQRRSTYEQVKQEQVNQFVAKHEQYHPKNDVEDKNWGALLNEFGLYKLPDDPRKIGELLERAHNSLAGTPSKMLDLDKAAKIMAQTRVNAAGTASTAGGNAGGGAKKKSTQTLPPEAKHLKGFSDEELKEIFG